MVVAALYGTSTIASAYRGALSATFIPTNFFTAESLNAVFIPLYKKYEKDSKQSAINYSWIMFILLGTISFIIAYALYISASSWVSLLVPGFSSDAKDMTVYFVKIMAVGIPFYVLCSVISYYEISNNQYLMTSIRPTVQSIGLILGALLAYYYKYIGFLSWGFTGAYIFLFLQGVYNLFRKKLVYYPQLSYSEVKRICKDFWKAFRPLLLLPIVLQGNIIIERRIASLIDTDVIPSLDYARFITETGVVLLAFPVGLVGLSRLSGTSREHVKESLQKIIPMLLMITVPVSAYLVVHSYEIIDLLYSRGVFNENSTKVTGYLLMGLSIGLWAQVIAYVLQKVLNSQLKNGFVLFSITVSILVNVVFNLLFYKILGSLTVGIGASLYGITLMVATACKLNIMGLILKYLLLMSPCILIGTFIGLIENNGHTYHQILSLVISAVLWITYYMVVPAFKKEVIFLVNYIKRDRMKT